MSQSEFYAILDDCVARLRQGEPLEACLAEYPDQATELNPVLVLSTDLLHLPPLEPAPEILAQGYETMMGAVVAQERPSRLAGLMSLTGKLLSPLKPQKAGGQTFALRLAMLLLVVGILSSAFVIAASADTLPGDALYPVKRSWENTRLALTRSEPSRQALESEFAEQRREEVQAVLELRRPVIVEFQGQLRSTGDDTWWVETLSVAINDDTDITGAIVVGQQIFVRAQVGRDGTLVALKIIEVEGDSHGADLPAGERRPTDRPEPTRGSQPTREPAPTRKPTDRPTHRPTREATATSAPTREATATHEPEPKDIPSDAITSTPEPRPTKTPSDKPADGTRPNDEPTRDSKPTPEPTATREPTHEPTATREPRPTATKASDSGPGTDRP